MGDGMEGERERENMIKDWRNRYQYRYRNRNRRAAE
jgi:hypothetical protein